MRMAAVFSPDGRLVAFASDESGKWEIYVASYGADGKLGLPVMVSVGGGGYPVDLGGRQPPALLLQQP